MLDLRHLVTLDAVAAEGTFGRAADRLGYTQSAVSQQIAALEKSVGGAVFDRPGGPKAVRLTPLGEVAGIITDASENEPIVQELATMRGVDVHTV